MADRIKGITIQIGGDTTGLSKALSNTNKEINSTKSQLKDVEKLLKLDPKNTELLEQKQKLLGDAIGQTKDKLSALKDAEKQAQEQFAKGEISEQQYMSLKREIEATEIELKDLETQAKNTSNSMEKIGATAEKVSKGANKIADSTKGLSVAASGVLAAAVYSSVGFEDSFAKVSTLLTDATEDWDAYKNAIIDASNETGIAASDFAEAVYSAISAGVDEAEAIAFVTAEAKLAKGGFTDMSKAVDVVTTALNGYGLSASYASNVNDLLIATQNEGKTTVDELASSMGQVIPVASASNTSLQELSAAYALLTKNGISTAQSGTYLKSMLSELSKTGSKTDQALRKISGKSFSQLKSEGKSVADILKMLEKYAKENNVTLKDMFGSTEAGSAALVLAKNSSKDFVEMLDTMNNSIGSTDEAFGKVSSTSGEKFKRSLNTIKNTGIELGDTLAPIISAIGDGLGNITNVLRGLDENQVKFLGTMLLVIAAISPLAKMIGTISSAISFMANSVVPALGKALSFLAANPFVLVIGAIVAVVAAIAMFGDEIQEVLGNVDDFMQNIFSKDFSEQFGFLGTILNGFLDVVKTIWDTIVGIFNGVIDFIRGVFTGDWKRAWNGVKNIFGSIFGGLADLCKKPFNFIIGMLNKVVDGLNWLIGGLNKISFDVPDWIPFIGGKTWGINIPDIPSIPYLAKGGVLKSGSAVVGEAGAEILTMTNSGAVVQPLNGSGASTSGLTDILSALNQYLPYLAEGNQIVLDTGALVGATAPAMNREFGRMANREAYR